MESIITEAIARAGESRMPIVGETDEELLQILQELKTNIVVIGCGGSGSNTIPEGDGRRSNRGRLVCHKHRCSASAEYQGQNKILIGRSKDKGLGAGSLPQIGQDAAQESKAMIEKAVGNADMVFHNMRSWRRDRNRRSARSCRSCTRSWRPDDRRCHSSLLCRGAIRMENAEAGLERLRDVVDTVIVVPNDKLLEVVPHLPLQAGLKYAMKY